MGFCAAAERGSPATKAGAPLGYLAATAHFSRCRMYRYALTRRLGLGERTILFIGLNPSTADATYDDPTIRRCVGFARRMGYDVLLMANLFGWRATDPRRLKGVRDPVGSQNDVWLRKLARMADTIVAAWGNGASSSERPSEVLAWFGRVYCFGQTDLGQPRHPLYLPSDSALTVLTS